MAKNIDGHVLIVANRGHSAPIDLDKVLPKQSFTPRTSLGGRRKLVNKFVEVLVRDVGIKADDFG